MRSNQDDKFAGKRGDKQKEGKNHCFLWQAGHISLIPL